MYRVFLDTETTGLSSTVNQILTMAIVIYDGDTIIHEEEFGLRIQRWARIDPVAMTVHKINLVEHNLTALEIGEFCEKIYSILDTYELEKPKPHGHNVQFDIRMVQAIFRRADKPYPFSIYYEDSLILARQLKKKGQIIVDNCQLSTLCTLFGLTAKYHNALEDTQATAKVYFALLTLRGTLI